jgi:outer membrane protein assembly factor BamD (BamD/ComL family)
MKKILIVLLMMAIMAGLGCSEQRAKELFETAQLEELQNNKRHASQLYEEIIGAYPESDYARKARERLKVFEQTNADRQR